jgi:hypothetical protein
MYLHVYSAGFSGEAIRVLNTKSSDGSCKSFKLIEGDNEQRECIWRDNEQEVDTENKPLVE